MVISSIYNISKVTPTSLAYSGEEQQEEKCNGSNITCDSYITRNRIKYDAYTYAMLIT